MTAYLTAPLRIAAGRVARTDDTAQSISDFLSLLISTPCGSMGADPDFGFVFNNLRFEIFDEREGVVYDSTSAVHDRNNPDDLYSKKVSGTSRNLNTFAQELKKAVDRYERRLSDVNVSMVYSRETRTIAVTVEGTVAGMEKKYVYHNNIRIWN